MEGINPMEGSTGDLLCDAENLLEDTKKRIDLSDDPDRSRDIRRSDIRLCIQNMNQFEKIYVECMLIRKINMNTLEVRRKFREVTNLFLSLRPAVKRLTKDAFGKEVIEVSSLVEPYSHLYYEDNS